jgi:hypothetical protein
MALIKVCPKCKDNEEATLTFFIAILYQIVGCLRADGVFEVIDSDYQPTDPNINTPVFCECGWKGIVGNLIQMEDINYEELDT